MDAGEPDQCVDTELPKDSACKRPDDCTKDPESSAKENCDTSPKPTKVEHIYRGRPVSEIRCSGEERMEASLHYLRGRTDALLMKINGGPRNYYVPPAFCTGAFPTDPQPFSYDPRRSSSKRNAAPTPAQFSIEASLQSLQKNKASLDTLYQQINSLKAALDTPLNRDRFPRSSARQYGARPTRPVRWQDDRSADRAGNFTDRFTPQLPRAFSAAPHTRTPFTSNRSPYVSPYPGYPSSRPSSRPTSASRVELQTSKYPPAKPSSFRRYLRNVRANLVGKDNTDDSAPARSRSKASPSARYNPPSDYQPSRNSENDTSKFKPIQLEKPVEEKPEAFDDQRNSTTPADDSPMQAVDDMLNQENDTFMDFGQADRNKANAADNE